jgi:hypothetical protein
MLDYAGFGADFRGFAVAVAVDIHKCNFRRGVTDVPIRLITGATQDLYYLHTFGCPSFVHIPRANCSKTISSACECISVGSPRDSPAWLAWMPDIRVVLAIRCVAFHE